MNPRLDQVAVSIHDGEYLKTGSNYYPSANKHCTQSNTGAQLEPGIPESWCQSVCYPDEVIVEYGRAPTDVEWLYMKPVWSLMVAVI